MAILSYGTRHGEDYSKMVAVKMVTLAFWVCLEGRAHRLVDRLEVGVRKIEGIKKDLEVWASVMGRVRSYHHLSLGKTANRVGYSGKVRN